MNQIEINSLKEYLNCFHDEHNRRCVLDKLIFNSEKMILTTNVDSCILHNLNHKDTEILGAFCDFTNIHGEKLKDILINGFLYLYNN